MKYALNEEHEMKYALNEEHEMKFALNEEHEMKFALNEEHEMKSHHRVDSVTIYSMVTSRADPMGGNS